MKSLSSRLAAMASGILLLCSGGYSLSSQAANADISTDTLAQTQFGPYAIGAKIIFARNEQQKFDLWNRVYASENYRQLLDQIDRSGQPRTIATHIWYPAKPAKQRLQQQQRLRNPLKAASGQQARIGDYVFNDPMMLPSLTRFFAEQLDKISDAQGVSLQKTLQQTPQQLSQSPSHKNQAEASQQILQRFSKQLSQQRRGAYLNAPAASGQFPLIVLSHGLSGNFAMWDRAGEFLASHGYIVAAPTFISDGTAPLVFHDPASEFAQQHNGEQLAQAYQQLAEPKVIPNFFKFLWNKTIHSPHQLIGFDPAQAVYQQGGAEKVMAMQQSLFRQRISDVSTVITTLKALGRNRAECRALVSGSVIDSCGLLAGKLDESKIGLSGHSLGSMTSQLALDYLPGITTTVALNNGAPFSWSPAEAFNNQANAQGLPQGNSKPVLQLIGNEDDFVQRIFYDISQSWVAMSGGPRDALMQLPTEQANISRDNPQPVALSAYQRAVGAKMLVTIPDVNHVNLTQHTTLFNLPEYLRDQNQAEFAEQSLRQRKPVAVELNQRDFHGASYQLLGWQQTPDDLWYYSPHVIRDYYYKHWFDHFLKGDQQALTRLQQSPAPKLLHIRSALQ